VYGVGEDGVCGSFKPEHPFHLRSDGVAGMAPTRASGSTPRSGNESTRFSAIERPFDTLGS